METSNTNSSKELINQKQTIEALSKDEIIIKYKGLLNIAKKAKQAKDELTEENRKLKEILECSNRQEDTDKKAMKEMIETLTENKLELVTQLNKLQHKLQDNEAQHTQLQIENESLKRQLNRLMEDNEALLGDIDRMEQQLQQVNALGHEQKRNLELLEVDINKLKEVENQNDCLKNQLVVITNERNNNVEELQKLHVKYQNVKEVNSEQCRKFNALKNRFVDVHRKLKNLKESKCVLLETQYDYANSITKWQTEIIQVSNLLFAKMNALQKENEQLKQKSKIVNREDNVDVASIINNLIEIEKLSDIVYQDQKQQYLEQQRLTQELQDLKVKLQDNEIKLLALREENTQLVSSSNDNLVSYEHTQQNNEFLNKELQLKAEEIKTLKLQLQNSEASFTVAMKQTQDEFETLLKHKEQQCMEAALKEKELQEIVRLELETIHKEKLLLKEQLETLRKSGNHARVYAPDKSQIPNEFEDLQSEKTKLCQQLNVLENNNTELNIAFQNVQQQSTDNTTKYEEFQQYNELQSRYEQKEREHADLLIEMRELNEALKSRGDVISRQQDKHKELVNQLKESLAKQDDLETALKSEKQAAQENTERLTAKFLELETELQNLREQTSNIDAQSDVLSTSTISRTEESSRLQELDDSYEEKYNKLRSLAVKLKKKLQEETAYVADMKEQLSATSGLKKELEQLQAELSTLKTENQKLKSRKQSNNVLNLEIEAAEKSLADVSAKLTAKCNELEVLNGTLIMKENTNVELRKEIEILEASKESEVLQSKQLKEQIDRMQDQLKDAVHNQQQTFAQYKDLEKITEQYKLELEELNLQLANNANKNEAVIRQSNVAQEKLATQLQLAEENYSKLETELKKSKRICEDLRIEYLEYKVKAQAVLRMNQSKEAGRERELEEELTAVRASEQHLQSNSQAMSVRLEQLTKQNEVLQEDNVNLQRRSRELLNLVEELRQQIEALEQDQQRTLQKQQDVLSTHRQQIDNMDTCHKLQLRQLQQQLELAQMELSKNTRQPTSIGATATATAELVITANTTTIQPQLPTRERLNSEQSKIDFLLMEREAAEGSEEAAETLAQLAAKRKISTASRRSQHDFIPLDELLNTPINAISDKVMTHRNYNRSATLHEGEKLDCEENAQITLQITKELLQKQESRVRHLTALLAENEQDLAKLTQMNDMLKEELRRQERSVEREQHMHNSEYLKNIVLKFLTLNNGDERLRLVPVLNTILKLSRNEIEMLNCVARGQRSDSSSRGWGSFLTSWGAGNLNNN